MGVGTKNNEGKTSGGGKDNVKKIVDSLKKGGVKNCYGIIDWDETENNRPEDHIFVLAQGERYAIENCILDPLLIIITVSYHYKQERVNFGLGESDNIQALLKKNQK